MVRGLMEILKGTLDIFVEGVLQILVRGSADVFFVRRTMGVLEGVVGEGVSVLVWVLGEELEGVVVLVSVVVDEFEGETHLQRHP